MFSCKFFLRFHHHHIYIYYVLEANFKNRYSCINMRTMISDLVIFKISRNLIRDIGIKIKICSKRSKCIV